MTPVSPQRAPSARKDGGQDALARPRRAGHEQRVAARQAAAEHLVQPRHAHQQRARRARPPSAPALRRGHCLAGAKTGCRRGSMRKVCSPGSVGLAAHLHDLHLAHHGVALHALAQPDQAVGHREHRVGVGLVEVLADQEGRGLPARHQHAQLLHELLQAGRAGCRRCSLANTTERNESTKTSAGLCAVTSSTMRSQHPVEVAGHGVVGQVDEAHAVVDGLAVEEVELLLVAQHLQRRLAQHGEVERRALRRGQREHDLVRQRGLAAARRPAMRLNENSGKPPPSTSSRPGTPVARRLMVALVVMERCPARAGRSMGEPRRNEAAAR